MSVEVLASLDRITKKEILTYIQTNKITLYRFAKETGVFYPNLHKYLSGKGTLNVKNIEKIGKYILTKGV
jgi:predicted transcriptional regulator